MTFLKNTPAGKRVAIRHQIRKRFMRDGVFSQNVAILNDILRSFNLNELRKMRKMYNAY